MQETCNFDAIFAVSLGRSPCPVRHAQPRVACYDLGVLVRNSTLRAAITTSATTSKVCVALHTVSHWFCHAQRACVSHPALVFSEGLRPRRSVRTAMAHEINMFGIVQKDQMGCAPRCSAHAAEPDLRLFLPACAVRSLDKAIEETKYRMSKSPFAIPLHSTPPAPPPQLSQSCSSCRPLQRDSEHAVRRGPRRCPGVCDFVLALRRRVSRAGSCPRSSASTCRWRRSRS